MNEERKAIAVNVLFVFDLDFVFGPIWFTFRFWFKKYHLINPSHDFDKEASLNYIKYSNVITEDTYQELSFGGFFVNQLIELEYKGRNKCIGVILAIFCSEREVY